MEASLQLAICYTVDFFGLSVGSPPPQTAECPSHTYEYVCSIDNPTSPRASSLISGSAVTTSGLQQTTPHITRVVVNS